MCAGRTPAAQLRYRTPEGKLIAQLELASPDDQGTRKRERDDQRRAERAGVHEELAKLHGFMRQLRARANWEVSMQAGL